jgi:positive regulator of sigma E activity
MTAPKTKKMSKNRSRATVARQPKEQVYESDSTYFLKLVVFILLGTLWLRFAEPISWMGIPMSGIPLGMLLGLVLVRKFEKYQSDRKIWYVILIIITIISYFVPSGIVI